MKRRPEFTKGPGIRSALFASICMLTLSSLACTISLFQLPTIPSGPTQPPLPVLPTPTPLPRAQTNFIVILPEPLIAGQSLAISVLDEVTGLALNPQMYPMQPRDSLTYTTTLALPFNALAK